MATLEKEKYFLSQELNDSKDKLLKFTKEQCKWEKERAYLIAQIDVLNQNQIVLEKEKEKKEKQSKTGQQSMETSIDGIVQAMSQFILKY